MVQYKLLLRVLLRKELLDYRRGNGDTQERMAEKLHISTRSYADLEHGKYGVSTVTLLFFLNLLSDAEKVQLVDAFMLQVKEVDENARIA